MPPPHTISHEPLPALTTLPVDDWVYAVAVAWCAPLNPGPLFTLEMTIMVTITLRFANFGVDSFKPSSAAPGLFYSHVVGYRLIWYAARISQV